MQPVQRLTYSIEEVSRILGISRSHAYEAVRIGEIPCLRIGHRQLIPKQAVDEMLSNTTNPSSQPSNSRNENKTEQEETTNETSHAND